jgi:Zn-dependent oligopeptidase
MNRNIDNTMPPWVYFDQHPRQTLEYQRERGRNRKNEYIENVAETSNVEKEMLTCLDMWKYWYEKTYKNSNDADQLLLDRYIQSDENVSCVYEVCLSIINITFLTYSE